MGALRDPAPGVFQNPQPNQLSLPAATAWQERFVKNWFDIRSVALSRVATSMFFCKQTRMLALAFSVFHHGSRQILFWSVHDNTPTALAKHLHDLFRCLKWFPGVTRARAGLHHHGS